MLKIERGSVVAHIGEDHEDVPAAGGSLKERGRGQERPQDVGFRRGGRETRRLFPKSTEQATPCRLEPLSEVAGIVRQFGGEKDGGLREAPVGDAQERLCEHRPGLSQGAGRLRRHSFRIPAFGRDL